MTPGTTTSDCRIIPTYPACATSAAANGQDAEDVVQEAYLRAFQYSAGFRGGDARAWLLTIVRNTSYRWLRKTRAYEPVVQFDEEIHTNGGGTADPEELLLQNAEGRLVAKTLSELPVRFREILVLRELEDLSYKEIAAIMGVPMGTVMSTLSRARDRFRKGAGRLLQNEHMATRPTKVPYPLEARRRRVFSRSQKAVSRSQEVCAPDERGAQVPGERHESCRREERASVHE